MKVLLVGGAGMVGTFVTPYLARHHELRVLDVRPPQHEGLVEYVPGSIVDPDALARALEGMDTFVDMVMLPAAPETTAGEIVRQYEVNALGVHLLLWTALQNGIRSGVYVSTRTVHDAHRRTDGSPIFEAEETTPVDNPSIYGFTKGLGERICQHFAQQFGMRLIALRITGPRSRDAFKAERRNPIHPGLYVMDEEDLANALLAALRVVVIGRARFDAVLIAADEREVDHNLTKAKTLLAWEPVGHLLLADD